MTKNPSIRALKLTVELVPSTCWYSNVRSNVTAPTWDRIQAATFQRARYICEICGGRGRHHPVECHEIWSYDDRRLVQRLDGLIALCPACHQVKHIGLAVKSGAVASSLNHFAAINLITPEAALGVVKSAFALHASRSEHTWSLDISWLARRHGVQLDAQQREHGLRY